MKKVHFFSDTDIFSLQLKINEWLSENRRIEIIDTGITYSDQYAFYILYMLNDRPAGEIGELVEEQKIVIEANEILPGQLGSN